MTHLTVVKGRTPRAPHWLAPRAKQLWTELLPKIPHFCPAFGPPLLVILANSLHDVEQLAASAHESPESAAWHRRQMRLHAQTACEVATDLGLPRDFVQKVLDDSQKQAVGAP